MNTVVDLADAKLKKENVALHGYMKFVEEAIELNENLIAENITKLNGKFDPDYIVDTYACQILGATISHKSKEELLEMITYGGLFEAKSILFEELMDNPVVIEAINKTTILGGK
jgi:hypothetical protein